MAQQPKKITAGSFSRWDVYAQCPLRAKYKFIDKIPEPPSDAMERGAKFHSTIEYYLKGATSRLPAEYNAKALDNIYKTIRDKRKKQPTAVHIEGEWAYRSDWTPTGWFDSDCWLRIKVDCAVVDREGDTVTARIYDWKTGKFWQRDQGKYQLQLELYALGALLNHQDASSVTVTPELVYVDVGMRHSVGAFTKADLPRLKKEWGQRFKPMFADAKFAPKPNEKCRWCQFSVAKNGPCKF